MWDAGGTNAAIGKAMQSLISRSNPANRSISSRELPSDLGGHFGGAAMDCCQLRELPRPGQRECPSSGREPTVRMVDM